MLITGASSGIGAALARGYANPHRILILHGRDDARLAGVARDCEARGAQVITTLFDLRDSATAIAMLTELSAAHVIDLAIVNAGVSSGTAAGDTATGGPTEPWERARAVMAVNIEGALATVAGVLPAMQQRRSGQIALISSLAAYIGMPMTPVYCASKAAVKVYGEALRGGLESQGIAVNVVLPGFVRTPMSERFYVAKPFMISPERAAVSIRRGLARNRARIAFPSVLAWGMWWLALMPPSLSQRILRVCGYSNAGIGATRQR